MWILPSFAKYVCKHVALLRMHEYICRKYSIICETYSCNKTSINLLLKCDIFKGLNRYLLHSHIFQDGLLFCMPLLKMCVQVGQRLKESRQGFQTIFPSEKKNFPKHFRLSFGTQTILYSDLKKKKKFLNMVFDGGKGIIFLVHSFPVCKECLCLTAIRVHTVIDSCLLPFKIKTSTR